MRVHAKSYVGRGKVKCGITELLFMNRISKRKYNNCCSKMYYISSNFSVIHVSNEVQDQPNMHRAVLS